MEDPISESLAEEPLLIFPIGISDQNCEELIEFEGAIPKAKYTVGKEFQRAITTIEFFSLNNANTRGVLFRERCDQILILGSLLLNGPPSSALDLLVKNFTSDTSKHANCARSFVKLVENDPEKAKIIYQEAKAFITTYVPN